MFRVRIGARIYGPARIEDFKRIPGFTLQSPIAPLGTDEWRPAYQMINLQKYFNYSVDNSYTQQDSATAVKTLMDGPRGVFSYSPKRRMGITSRLFLAVLLMSLGAGAAGWHLSSPAQKQQIEYQARQLADKARLGAIALINAALLRLEP